ncbi:hypothetical protein BDV37DRAFT_278883 [Aspergillus pseudonomiae]|uniref:Caspase domain-containing protein n=1 Tax=Aspergillus pseudonomiae TaxID=1506151 RepID=A0A5N7DPP1_9EURO|nr:uncharacterized protein BDV37DRAFT_278883 [Aspergillus pseudonomiae]KAE8408394.1 hypothetical protein BDV37DRAFT_278883 [Aspergillus pseudonomiae]
MASVIHDQFKATLQAAMQQKSGDYKNVYPITVRWVKDDTDAGRGAEHFRKMLKDLDVGRADELIICADDPAPRFTFEKAWVKFLGNAIAETERNLVIFHYAGHGMTKTGSFVCADTRAAKKTINANRYLLRGVKDPHAHTATRAPAIPRRVVEVLAATSITTPLARSGPDNTFNGKLAGEVARRKRQGHKHVEFADVFQSLRSRADKV